MSTRLQFLRLVVVPLALCAFAGHARAQLRIILPDHIPSVVPPKPGLYVYIGLFGPFSGDVGGGALRVTASHKDLSFEGSLEMFQVDRQGKLLDLRSRFSAHVVQGSCPRTRLFCVKQKKHMTEISFGASPLDVSVLDEPLRSMLGKVTALLGQAHGDIRLDWSGPSDRQGWNLARRYAGFALATQQEYDELTADLRTQAALVQQDEAIKRASASYITQRIDEYMAFSDAWQKTDSIGETRALMQHANTLYADVLASLKAADRGRARHTAMQMRMLLWQAWQIQITQQDGIAFLNNMNGAIASASELSPCLRTQRYPPPGASATCQPLKPLLKAFEKRSKQLVMPMARNTAKLKQMDRKFQCLVAKAYGRIDVRPAGYEPERRRPDWECE